MRLLVLTLAIAAGCATAPQPAAPLPAASAGEPGRVVKGELAIDPMQDPYRVRLPDHLNVPGARYWAMVKFCMTAEGVPTEVTLIRPAHPDLDPLIVRTLARWRYKPYTVDGRGVAVCSNFRYNVHTR